MPAPSSRRVTVTPPLGIAERASSLETMVAASAVTAMSAVDSAPKVSTTVPATSLPSRVSTTVGTDTTLQSSVRPVLVSKQPPAVTVVGTS